ncbi:MAG: hypothetical protein J6Y92_01705 [Lentisphaeria bacterium]|nr:hypothetical protein [Lentisphaeria bacterium]
MKKRRLLIVLFLAVVTALAVVSELRLSRESASNTASARLVLPEFRPEDVRSLEISWRTQKSTLDFVEDGRYWAVKERAGAQAASAQVADLLEGLAKAAPLKELEISGIDDYRDLNLVTPEEIAEPGADAALKNSEGILAVLRDRNGAELLRIMLGRGHTRLAADRIGNLAVQGYDGRYIRVWYPDKSSRVFLISRVFEKCVPNPRQWIEQLFLSKPENPVYARFQHKRPGAETSSVVWFVNAGKDDFQLLFPSGELDMEAFSQKYSALAAPFSIDLVNLPMDDMEFNDIFQTVMGDGFAYLLEFARFDSVSAEADADVYAGRMTVSFDPDNVHRLIGEPDDAFEHRKKQLASRAEYEKRTANGRVFLLKTGLLELLAQPPAKTLKTAAPHTSATTPSAEKTAPSAEKKEE